MKKNLKRFVHLIFLLSSFILINNYNILKSYIIFVKLDIYCTNNTITYNIELTIDFGSNFFQIFKLAFKVLGFV